MTNTDKTNSNKTQNMKYKVSYRKDGSPHAFFEEELRGDAEDYCFGESSQSEDEWGVVTHLRSGAYWKTKHKIVQLDAGEYGSYYWDDINTGEDFCEVVAAIEDGSAFIE